MPGAVSGDRIIFLSEPQDGIELHIEAVWWGRPNRTGTLLREKVVLKGIPPAVKCFDYERDITPVLEETSYTEKANWGKWYSSIAILPPPISSETRSMEESKDKTKMKEREGKTSANRRKFFQLSFSLTKKIFSELLSIPKKGCLLDIFTPVSFQIECTTQRKKC